jgi:hypothetical protein
VHMVHITGYVSARGGHCRLNDVTRTGFIIPSNVTLKVLRQLITIYCLPK